jgi:integrase
MLDNDKSLTSVGIYLRGLRAVFNYCISQGLVKRDEHYPFGKHQYIIPAGQNIKKALTNDELRKIFDYKTIPKTFEDRAKDFWIFSYLCSGINFKDVAMLKWKNIDGDMLRFVREKTKRSSQGNQKHISCYLTDQTKAIIDKWGNTKEGPDGYIFSILEMGDSSEKQMAKIDQFIQNTNKNMKRISVELGLSKLVTTYYSRHSAATMMKRSGATINQIQEALGHSNPLITQKYLDSFEDEVKIELSKALIPQYT